MRTVFPGSRKDFGKFVNIFCRCFNARISRAIQYGYVEHFQSFRCFVASGERFSRFRFDIFNVRKRCAPVLRGAPGKRNNNKRVTRRIFYNGKKIVKKNNVDSVQWKHVQIFTSKPNEMSRQSRKLNLQYRQINPNVGAIQMERIPLKCYFFDVLILLTFRFYRRKASLNN